MLYLIEGFDKTDSLPLRKQTRGEHLKYLELLRTDGRLILAGPCPKIDSPEPGQAGMSGSLIVAEFDSLDQARSWADKDPYMLAGVFERVLVRPFIQVLP